MEKQPQLVLKQSSPEVFNRLCQPKPVIMSKSQTREDSKPVVRERPGTVCANNNNKDLTDSGVCNTLEVNIKSASVIPKIGKTKIIAV